MKEGGGGEDRGRREGGGGGGGRGCWAKGKGQEEERGGVWDKRERGGVWVESRSGGGRGGENWGEASISKGE